MKNHPKKNNNKPRVWAFSFLEKALLSTGLMAIAFLISYPFLKENNQAVLYLGQKKHDKAETKWRKALSQAPFSPLYRLNLALNYQLSEQTNKALQEYTVTQNFLSSPSQKKAPNMLFYSFFNSALTETQNNNIKKALNFYQSALTWHPHSLEVKTNIELLTKNLKPDNEKKGEKNPEKGEDPQKNNSNSSSKSPPQEENQEENPEENQEEKNQAQAHAQDLKNQQEKKDQDSKGQEDKKDSQTEDPSQSEDADTKKAEDPLQKNQKPPHTEKEGEGHDNHAQGQEPLDPNQISGQPQNYQKHETNKNLSKDQTEAILKAILEQETQIKKRRQSRKKRSSPKEKDW